MYSVAVLSQQHKLSIEFAKESDEQNDDDGDDGDEAASGILFQTRTTASPSFACSSSRYTTTLMYNRKKEG